MRPRKYLDKEADICAAYVAGERPRDIARRYDMPQRSVGTILERFGVRRSRAQSKRQRIIANYGQASAKAVADLVGCTPTYVRAVARECGLRSEVQR